MICVTQLLRIFFSAGGVCVLTFLHIADLFDLRGLDDDFYVLPVSYRVWWVECLCITDTALAQRF